MSDTNQSVCSKSVIVAANSPLSMPMEKRPAVGDKPKRGIKSLTLKFKNRGQGFKPHHQKTLIIELLEFKQGEAKLSDLVDIIESNPEMLARMKTVQSPYNCVVYHAKDLQKCGYLDIIEEGTVKAAKATEDVKLIVEYSNNKAKAKVDVVTEEDFGEALQVSK